MAVFAGEGLLDAPIHEIGDMGIFLGLGGAELAQPVVGDHLTKQAINSSDKPLAEGLRDESYLFQQLCRTESGQRNMKKFLEVGGQTREGELKIQELNGLLGNLG
jgi:hypothetical protein